MDRVGKYTLVCPQCGCTLRRSGFNKYYFDALGKKYRDRGEKE